MNSLPDSVLSVYSNLDVYQKQVDEYIDKAKHSKPGVSPVNPLGKIFDGIEQINKADDLKTAVQQVAGNANGNWNKTNIKVLNSHIKEAKYQSEVLGTGKLSFKRLATWLKFTFTKDPKKLGITYVDVDHFLTLVKKTAKTEVKDKPITTHDYDTGEAVEKLNTIITKFNNPALSQGAFVLTSNKKTLYIVEKADSGEAQVHTYNFSKVSDGKFQVSIGGRPVGTFDGPEAFLKEWQSIQAKKELLRPEVRVGDYTKIDVGQTNEGKDFKFLVKTSDTQVEEKRHFQPNMIKSGERTYFDKSDFIAKIASNLRTTPIEKKAYQDDVIQVDSEAEALKNLAGKPPGSYMEVFTVDRKQMLVMAYKDEKGATAFRSFPFTTEKPKPQEGITGAPKAAIEPASLDAKEKRMATIDRLKQYVANGHQENVWKAMQPFSTNVPGARVPFIIQDSDVKSNGMQTSFRLVASAFKDPKQGRDGTVYFDRFDDIHVLDDGRIQHGNGRIFPSFDDFMISNNLSEPLAGALLSRSLGEPVKADKATVERQLRNTPGAKTCQIWTDSNKTYITTMEGPKLTTYESTGMIFDEKTGQPMLQFKSSNNELLNIAPDGVAKQFGMTLRQVDTSNRLKDLVMATKPQSVDKVLEGYDDGYLLLGGKDDPTTFKFVRYEPGKVWGWSEAEYTLKLLPNGQIDVRNSEGGQTGVYKDLAEFHKVLKSSNSIKDLMHLHNYTEAQIQEIHKHIAAFKKEAGDAWSFSEDKATKLLAQAKEFNIQPNGCLLFRDGESSRLVILSQNQGRISCEVLPSGKVILVGDEKKREYPSVKAILDEKKLTFSKGMQTDVDARNAAADAFKKKDGYHWGTDTQVRAAFESVKGQTYVKPEDYAGLFAYNVDSVNGAKHATLTYLDADGSVKQTPFQDGTPLPQVIKSDRSLSKIENEIYKLTPSTFKPLWDAAAKYVPQALSSAIAVGGYALSWLPFTGTGASAPAKQVAAPAEQEAPAAATNAPEAEEEAPVDFASVIKYTNNNKQQQAIIRLVHAYVYADRLNDNQFRDNIETIKQIVFEGTSLEDIRAALNSKSTNKDLNIGKEFPPSATLPGYNKSVFTNVSRAALKQFIDDLS
ncbi:MAG: hypothetical protein JSR37_10075 [Verrucomicrobia bacterium]|nr:hypothetical protein [Verrucomicrobiota bacterium]MBS0637490.1 hypothetical protein [Verrucomicrobiota bacterium]